MHSGQFDERKRWCITAATLLIILILGFGRDQVEAQSQQSQWWDNQFYALAQDQDDLVGRMYSWFFVSNLGQPGTVDAYPAPFDGSPAPPEKEYVTGARTQVRIEPNDFSLPDKVGFGMELRPRTPSSSMSVYFEGAANVAFGRLRGAESVVVPLFLKQYNGQNSVVYVKNHSAEAGLDIELQYIKTGDATPAAVEVRYIPPSGSVRINPETDAGLSGVAGGFLGSLRINPTASSLSRAVSAQAFVYQTGNDQAVYGYEGVPSDDADSTLHVPLFRSGWFGDTGISVVNPNAGPVQVELIYRGADVSGNQCANQVVSHGPVSVPGYSSALFFQGPGAQAVPITGDHGLPRRCFGSATIQSVGGNVLAVVNDASIDYQNGAKTLESAAFVAQPTKRGGKTTYVPFAPDQYTDERWFTGLQILNVAPTASNATVTFYDADGNTIPCPNASSCSLSLDPGEAGNVTLLDGQGPPMTGPLYRNEPGHAVVQSTSDVVVGVTIAPLAPGTADRMSYNGDPQEALDAPRPPSVVDPRNPFLPDVDIRIENNCASDVELWKYDPLQNRWELHSTIPRGGMTIVSAKPGTIWQAKGTSTIYNLFRTPSSNATWQMCATLATGLFVDSTCDKPVLLQRREGSKWVPVFRMSPFQSVLVRTKPGEEWRTVDPDKGDVLETQTMGNASGTIWTLSKCPATDNPTSEFNVENGCGQEVEIHRREGGAWVLHTRLAAGATAKLPYTPGQNSVWRASVVGNSQIDINLHPGTPGETWRTCNSPGTDLLLTMDCPAPGVRIEKFESGQWVAENTLEGKKWWSYKTSPGQKWRAVDPSNDRVIEELEMKSGTDSHWTLTKCKAPDLPTTNFNVENKCGTNIELWKYNAATTNWTMERTLASGATASLTATPGEIWRAKVNNQKYDLYQVPTGTNATWKTCEPLGDHVMLIKSCSKRVYLQEWNPALNAWTSIGVDTTGTGSWLIATSPTGILRTVDHPTSPSAKVIQTVRMSSTSDKIWNIDKCEPDPSTDFNVKNDCGQTVDIHQWDAVTKAWTQRLTLAAGSTSTLPFTPGQNSVWRASIVGGSTWDLFYHDGTSATWNTCSGLGTDFVVNTNCPSPGLRVEKFENGQWVVYHTFVGGWWWWYPTSPGEQWRTVDPSNGKVIETLTMKSDNDYWLDAKCTAPDPSHVELTFENNCGGDKDLYVWKTDKWEFHSKLPQGVTKLMDKPGQYWKVEITPSTFDIYKLPRSSIRPGLIWKICDVPADSAFFYNPCPNDIQLEVYENGGWIRIPASDGGVIGPGAAKILNALPNERWRTWDPVKNRVLEVWQMSANSDADWKIATCQSPFSRQTHITFDNQCGHDVELEAWDPTQNDWQSVFWPVAPGGTYNIYETPGVVLRAKGVGAGTRVDIFEVSASDTTWTGCQSTGTELLVVQACSKDVWLEKMEAGAWVGVYDMAPGDSPLVTTTPGQAWRTVDPSNPGVALEQTALGTASDSTWTLSSCPP